MAYRVIERKYENLYAKVYAKRAALISGLIEPEAATLAKFEEIKKALVDE